MAYRMLTWDVWNCSTMELGVQFVMISGPTLMQKWLVGEYKWSLLKHTLPGIDTILTVRYIIFLQVAQILSPSIAITTKIQGWHLVVLDYLEMSSIARDSLK